MTTPNFMMLWKGVMWIPLTFLQTKLGGETPYCQQDDAATTACSTSRAPLSKW